MASIHILPHFRRFLLRQQYQKNVRALGFVGYNTLMRCSRFSTHTHDDNSCTYKNGAVIVAGALISAFGAYYYMGGRRHIVHGKAISSAPASKPGLPLYTLSDVAKHGSKQDGVWVTFGEGVYDITSFVDKHPGGDKILIAAGGSVEPFWALYAVHRNTEILEMLEEYRIGNLSPEEAKEALANMDDPYAAEPRRHPALKPSSKTPFNAEPPLELLVDSFITPTDLFYVRNHLPVPTVDPNTYELEISGIGPSEVSFSLQDLRTKFHQHSITAAIQCAGNRRSEMSQVKPVKGLNWGAAAIGNATWTGARLCDVLRAAGLKGIPPGAGHIQFEGLDTDVSNVPYGASIPIEKALDPKSDILLAYEMNGEPLSRDHGYPVRAIVPGIVGARNVKWLGRIVVSAKESSSHWQQNDYKGFCPSVDWDSVDFKTSPAIQELPVMSAICDPAHGSTAKLRDGKLVVRGYAWSGGGQRIVRVDVTVDAGRTWHCAVLTDQEQGTAHGRHWGWTLWEMELAVPGDTKQVEIWAKAVDSSYNTQPEKFENIWNLRGVLSNAYHRVKVTVAHS